MRTRHRPPTLVSMWMLDVFCCALGCVILLLLLKMREASITAEESAQVSAELTDARLALDDSLTKGEILRADVDRRDGKIAKLVNDVDAAAREIALVRNQRDEMATKLATAEGAIKTAEANLALVRKKLDEFASQLALTQDRSTKTADELARKNSDLATLAKKIAEAEKNQNDLQRLLREKESLQADAQKRVLDLSDRLNAAQTKLKNSEKQIDDLSSLRTKVDDLEKQLADANVTIVDLQGTKAKLADKVNQLQIESDQRFAGIAMTGKNVVFLVDMSGSMDRTDENTVDPTKWPTVRDTLIKVMRSLPDLTLYQVILFSSKHSYLLGSDAEWLKYEREKSIEQVRKAMTATKPAGDTNLYAAFTETFKYRSKGLDTIYLLSDGLPTSGPGLSAAEERTITSETERGVILARYLRGTLRTVWNSPAGNRPRVRINSIGFFYESPDVGAFLWALSRENDGSFVGMSRP